MNKDRTTAASIVPDELGLGARGQSERAFLVVYQGQGDGSRGYVVPVPESQEVTVGRLEDNTIAIDHELVSRRHARIIRHRADIQIEDLESRNGTRVNGIAIRGPTRISSGDEITIGPASIIVGVTTFMQQQTLVGSAYELEDRLAAEIDRASRYRRPLGLAMIRLDGPHEAAAAAIEAVGNDLRKMDYLAQYGPDELAVVLPEADRAATQMAAQRLIEAAREAGIGQIEVRVGMAVCPEDGTTPGELLSRARAALRAARVGRPGQVAAPPAEDAAPSSIVVVAPIMQRVFAMARKVADTPITVLILGETGAGKEIVAGYLHQQSARKDKPFQALNCSALPETLLESELFGHERGAFTGADRRKIGYFEAAHGGTIFLDEVGEMPLSLQAVLLRVLEQRTVTRVGGTEPVAIDARVVCATNRDLEAEVARERFREDLYFRISAFTLVVPPLRDRRPEIVPLAEHFARQFALELGQPPPAFSAEATAALEQYHWPGNVRELRNAIERAVVLQPRGTIGAEHLPDRIALGGPPPSRTPPGEPAPALDVRSRVADVERAAVISALELCGGNQTRAAHQLGVSRFALIRLMQKYGLKKPPRSER